MSHKRKIIDVLPDYISALVLDFDGVFTNNRVIVFQDGKEAVVCNRSDGLGLLQLKQIGIPILVLSSEKNPVVLRRCTKLGLEVLQVGLEGKLLALEKWIRTRKLDIERIIYIGNDINDLQCMEAVGCSIAVKNAYPEVKKVADVVLSKCGGNGAIREICDIIVSKKLE